MKSSKRFQALVPIALLIASLIASSIAPCCLAGAAPPAASTASPAPQTHNIQTRTVQFKSGTETISGYLALPHSPGKHPALIIVHEWWGLNDWTKEQTRKLADAGYVALAVDLFRGDVPKDLEEAHEVTRGVPDDRALRDLEAGFTFLTVRPDVIKTKIGAIGWSIGGGYALDLAVREPKLAACVVNYGAMPTNPASLAKIHASVLGNFGAEDHGISPEAVHTFESAMKAAGKSVDVKVYSGAGHAFANQSIGESYRSAAAADAWNRTLIFLAKTLK